MVRLGALLTAALVLAGCAAEGQTLGVSADGARVQLDHRSSVEIVLEGNATTGFSWELVAYDPAVIAPEGEPVYEEAETGMVGGGGAWVWTLVAQDPGECTVEFVYHRTWEDDPPERTFSFTAVVGG